MSSPASQPTLDEYLTVVPRGLQDVVLGLLPSQIREACAGDATVIVNLEFVGEDPVHFVSGHLEELRHGLIKATAKKKQKRQRLNPENRSLIDLTSSPYGNVYDARTKRHVGLGFDMATIQSEESPLASTSLVWSLPGANTGTVWVRFSTNASPRAVASCRCIGPLLALVKVYDASESTEESEHSTMEQVLQDLRQAMEPSRCDWQKPLSLWQRHLRPEEKEFFTRKDTPKTFRCSCVRDDSKKYPYARHELLQQAAKYMSPPEASTDWKVDLVKFDLELVWFYRRHASAIALSLRDYASVGAVSFGQGDALPPDITPPYLRGELLKETIRLRPTTAQLLLYMANLKTGDIILDPCVGLGTIVMECLHLRQPPYLVAMGGDLKLKESLRTKAVDYEMRTRRWLAQQVGRKRHSQAFLCAWDATVLPLAPASVDAIVSDLPFGRSCLSSAILVELVPLFLADWARVLRPTTGRMVLLCGNPQVLLDALHQANQQLQDHAQADASSLLWELPVPTCRPVNIGGHLVWVLVIHRGSRPRLKGPNETSLRKYHSRRDERTSLPQR